MTDDVMDFDPSLKKKKKKKAPVKTEDEPEIIEDMKKDPVDDLGDELDEFSLTKKKKKKTVNLDDIDLKEANMDENSMGDFDPSLKKKKKKKKEFNEEEVLDNDAVPDDDNFGGFDMTKKKKKKKKALLEDVLGEGGEDEAEDMASDTWASSERDYTYEELLKRAIDIMKDKNPDLQAGEKKKYVMKPPQVLKHGSKKTSFANFLEICKMLHRSSKHVQDFLMAELGTSGSVDGYNQLLIKGRFQQKNIEGVLKRYIREYVTCHTCRSAETLLQKEGRLHFLQCEQCGSRCSVQSIKSGFQAVTGKRKQLRDKQG